VTIKGTALVIQVTASAAGHGCVGRNGQQRVGEHTGEGGGRFPSLVSPTYSYRIDTGISARVQCTPWGELEGEKARRGGVRGRVGRGGGGAGVPTPASGCLLAAVGYPLLCYSYYYYYMLLL
jgi:hypothetical protein